MEQNPSVETMLKSSKWSSLPDDIFSDIITRLRLPEYSTFTNSATTFDIKLGSPPWNEISKHWNILENLFTIFASPLTTTFRLNITHVVFKEPCSWNIIDSWARQLPNLEHLQIECNNGNLSDSGLKATTPNFFQLHSLVSLHLDLLAHWFDWDIPNSIIFPKLKKLNLFMAKCNPYVGRLISSCPSLEELSIFIFTVKKGSVLISSKSLLRLFIKIGWDRIHDCVIDSPNLEIFSYKYHSSANHTAEVHQRMLDTISRVTRLILDIPHMSLVGNISTKTIFPSMTHLQLYLDSIETFETLGLMLDCPNLEVLVLTFDGDYRWNYVISEATFLSSEHLKRIELRTNVRFNQQLLHLITDLVRSNLVLEKLIITAWYPYICDDNLAPTKFYQSVSELLVDFSRCQIEFLGNYKLSSPRDCLGYF